MAWVGDLPAEGKASDAARGIALLVVGIEVNAARFVGPPHEGHGGIGGPLEGGDGVGLGRGVQVAGEQGGLAALRGSQRAMQGLPAAEAASTARAASRSW